MDITLKDFGDKRDAYDAIDGEDGYSLLLIIIDDFLEIEKCLWLLQRIKILEEGLDLDQGKDQGIDQGIDIQEMVVTLLNTSLYY